MAGPVRQTAWSVGEPQHPVVWYFRCLEALGYGVICSSIDNLRWILYALRMNTRRPGRLRPEMTTETTSTSCCGESVPEPRVAALDDVAIEGLASRLKALADPTRLRLLQLLAQQPEPLCVCEITPRFAQHQPTISHHLRLLREAGLVGAEKRGVWSYFWATETGRRCLLQAQTLA